MKWNWEQADWLKFTYDTSALELLEAKFLRESGIMIGALRHLNADDEDSLKVELISSEAFKTSEIEGEILNRDSLQSSIRRQFGLQSDGRKVPPLEQGIAEMMVNLYRTFETPLTHETLFEWHRMLCNGRRDLVDVGRYRTHEDAMQVVSGAIHRPKVHFEAPPSKQMQSQMNGFLKWFNESQSLPTLTRSGIAHQYFLSIHPFEDGNGRIGRAIVEKAIAQNFGQPSLLALSSQIEKGRSAYYHALEAANKGNEITSWLLYFAQLILDAQKTTETHVQFLIEKAKLYDRLRGQLNERQEQVVTRMFREGPEGFEGGLSAKNYVTITEASTATATRDLRELVALGALTKTGELKATRYWLNVGGQ
jgi:Fic family protein